MSRCVKSGKSRGALACAFLVGAWGKLLCRFGRHDTRMARWYWLELVGYVPGRHRMGERLEWRCHRPCCKHALTMNRFNDTLSRVMWSIAPDMHQVKTLRAWK